MTDFGCLHVYSQVFDVVQTNMEFAGTLNDAGNRIDGSLKFVTQVSPQATSQAPPNVMSGTTQVTVFASKES